MGDMKVVPVGLEAFAGVQEGAATAITTAGSVNATGMMSAAAAAVGPIGAIYLAAYGPAQAVNLAGTLLLGAVHAGTGVGTVVSKASYAAVDSEL
ncbi:hypothetical protein [Mycobacterium sp. NPDC050853]|uniref:hypothetical protein n=1 Tax=Mycobacterium sp. NPDC050853 TaxID=3155160 RepID=UPI00340AA228